MLPFPLKLILSLTTLSLLLVAAAFTYNSGPATPALTSSTSELPPPPQEHLFYVGAAYAAPRSIPWNCDDWQPSPAVEDADDPRVSLILESLAANRGKTIYCAIDQSDTFTKAETWAAGRHRNERDDTVYFGQSGNFRGFLAAQEGYLTDGESGVTGVSRDLIFEFPREQRRGKKTITVTKRLSVPAHNSRLLQSGFGTASGNNVGEGDAKAAARQNFLNNPATFDFQSDAETAAAAYCAAQGYQRAVNPVASTPGVIDLNAAIGWGYSVNYGGGGFHNYQARRTSTWTATCERKEKRRVRRR